MAYENIRSTVPFFTIDSEGYFCTFNTTLNIIQKSTQSGDIAFTYPSLDDFTSGSYGSIIDICYDGSNFWTLNREGSTRRNWTDYGGWIYDYAIKKWAINKNNTVTKELQFDYVNSDINDVFVPTSFSVEAYKTTFSTTVSGNSPYVNMSEYADSPRLDPGDKLYLGPNSTGHGEYVTVTGTIDPTTVGLTFYTIYTYESGDSITFNKVIHVFNKFNSIQYGDDSDGSLLTFNPIDGSLNSNTISAEYKNITASSFSYITAARNVSNFYSIVYIKNNSARFLDIDDLTTVMTMNIDNIQSNNSTNITVNNLVVYNGSLYRLQLRSMYYETDYVWSTYNYVLSPIREFLDSIVVSTDPRILPSNGVSNAVVTAIVNDQYSTPLNSTRIGFEDDNETGFINRTPVYTDVNGVALTTYFSGISPATVIITAIALAVDPDGL